MLANHALRDKKVILFYFAARSAAKDFAPHLREAYEVRPVRNEEIIIDISIGCRAAEWKVAVVVWRSSWSQT